MATSIGFLVMSLLGFKARVDFAYSALFTFLEGMYCTLPEIHLWNHSWSLTHLHQQRWELTRI